MSESKKPVFGLVHGSWHGAWCWKYLQPELKSRGYDSVTTDLPIEDPSANFEDYADVAAESFKGIENLVSVGHSRAGNVIPRLAGRMTVQRQIFLCTSFELSTLKPLNGGSPDGAPPRNSEEFEKSIVWHADGLTSLKKDMAKAIFYNDCSPEVQDYAISHLRYQRRSDDEPMLQSWQDGIAQDYIVCTNDLVLNPEWGRYAARNWLGVEPVDFAAGHSPFLSKPAELADLLIRLAEQGSSPAQV